jgi:hypothetical protein
MKTRSKITARTIWYLVCPLLVMYLMIVAIGKKETSEMEKELLRMRIEESRLTIELLKKENQ